MLKSLIYSSALLFICYFILYKGTIAAFKKPTSNLDFDFSTGQLKYGNAHDYRLFSKVSSGKHSHVFLANHLPTKDKTVMKIFVNSTEFQVLKEFSVSLKLYDAPNVLPPRDFLREVGRGGVIKHVLVFNYFESKPYLQMFSFLTKLQIKHLIYQTLRTLEYAHSQEIIHNDIRPLNILMNENTLEVRVIDWGQSEYYFPDRERTTKVGTLFYKAPELLLDYRGYDSSVDIWSLGCVLAELVFKELPFFQNKKRELIDETLPKEQRKLLEYMTQLEAIMGVRGSEEIKEYADKYKGRMNLAGILQRVEGVYEEKSFKEFINDENRGLVDDLVIDLLDKMLAYDHEKRISASEALRHPYFDDIRGGLEVKRDL